MNEKPSWPPIVLCWTITLGLVGLLTSQTIMASQQLSDESILSEIVSNTVKIMRRNGHEMPDYRVRDGSATDVPVSGPPEKYAFFAYREGDGRTFPSVMWSRWIDIKPIYAMHFYEADQIPVAARTQLIDYLINLHEARGRNFTLYLRMTRDRYKKPQITMPPAFIELKLNRIEH